MEDISLWEEFRVSYEISKYEFLILLVYATCSAHLMLFRSMILIMLGEEYKLWSFPEAV
jgi:hypothetical protein